MKTNGEAKETINNKQPSAPIQNQILTTNLPPEGDPEALPHEEHLHWAQVKNRKVEYFSTMWYTGDIIQKVKPYGAYSIKKQVTFDSFDWVHF